MDFPFNLFKIFIWLFFLIGISFFLNYFWSKFLPGKIKQLIIFPGTLVHEISHALGCVITGAKIKEVALFSPRGSYVSHSKPIIPLVGSFIISFSPIAGSIGALALFFQFFKFNLPLIDLSLMSLYQSFLVLFKEAIIFAINNYQSWQFWVFSYLAVSLIISLVPSKQDFKNSFLSSIFIAIVLAVLLYFGIFSDQILDFLQKSIAGVLGIGVFFGFSAIVVTLPFYLIKKLI